MVLFGVFFFIFAVVLNRWMSIVLTVSERIWNDGFNLMLSMPVLGMIFLSFWPFTICWLTQCFIFIHHLCCCYRTWCSTHEPRLVALLNNQFYLDALSLILLVLTTFISLMVAIFSNHYMRHNLESGRINLKFFNYIM